MTSSASRGLSFRRACHLLVVMPSFAIEQNLMEIIQVIYRGRGKRKEEDEKFLTFYLLEQIIYRDSEDEQEKHALLKYYKRAIQKRILNIINLLLILKTSIMTRIRGSGRIGNNEYLMVPVGGKFVSTSGDTFSSRMSNLLKMLKQEQYRYPSDNVLKALDERLSKLLNHSTFILSGLSEKEMITAPYLKLLDSFEECFVTPIRHSLATLLKQEPLAPAYINGSLLIIPLKGHKLHQSTHINLWRQLMPALNPEMLRQMQGMANNTKKYPEELCSAMKQAVELIKELQDVEKSQQLEQDSQRDDLYVAIPLFAMLIPKIEFTCYFTNNSEENNEHSFRKLLSFHVRSLAPADGILPIGTQYDSFPFILFRSESLPELRKKLFTERQLLASSELNILNLLLSSKSSAQKKKVERE